MFAHSLARQFVRFAAVGAAATLVHYAILIALVEIARVGPIPATCAGFVAGAIVSYALNRRFTFDARPRFARGLALFFVVAAIGFALNVLIVASLIGWRWPYLMAQIVATGLVLIWNFAAARFFVFKP